jgi:hypothetical protein
MLNMFIAILGNTYQEVKEDWKRNKFFQKVDTIYELELLMLWNFKSKNEKFLVYGKNEKENDLPTREDIQDDLKKYKLDIEKRQKH